MKIFFLSIMLALILPASASAADTFVPVPTAMQQRWIPRACTTGRMSYRFSNYFLLTSIYAGSKLTRIGGLVDHGEGRYSLGTSKEKTGYVLGTTGDLLQYFGDSAISFTAAALENKAVRMPYITFKNCSTDVPMEVQEDKDLRALMPQLDKIHLACPTRQDIYNQPACQEAVFLLFDRSGDGALDTAEMKWGWDIILPRSFRSCGPVPAGPDELESDSAAYMAWMAEHLDSNKDGKISFPEIEGQWSALQSDLLMSGLTNMLIAAQKPLEILPEEVKLTCFNCCIATGKTP